MSLSASSARLDANVSLPPRLALGWRIKYALDRPVALLLLIAALPLLLLAVLAIRLESPGPVLFRQPRYGRHRRVITVYKLRTMRTSCSDPLARRLTTAGDPRVTRVGRLLRRGSLDELPQLWNVVRGEMSLVGPRPHALGARAGELLYPEAVSRYPERYRVKPGLTGLAQVTGRRGATPTRRELTARVARDLWYIENWSFGLDLMILLRTPLAMAGRNSY